MKTLTVAFLLLLVVLSGHAFAGPRGYEMNPAAQKQAERQWLKEAQRQEAADRHYRQLLLEYLAAIERNQRRGR